MATTQTMDNERKALTQLLTAMQRYNTSIVLLREGVYAMHHSDGIMMLVRVPEDEDTWEEHWAYLWRLVLGLMPEQIPAISIVCPAVAQGMDPAIQRELMEAPNEDEEYLEQDDKLHGGEGKRGIKPRKHFPALCSAHPRCMSGMPYYLSPERHCDFMTAMEGAWDGKRRTYDVEKLPVTVHLASDAKYSVTSIQHVPRPSRTMAVPLQTPPLKEKQKEKLLSNSMAPIAAAVEALTQQQQQAKSKSKTPETEAAAKRAAEAARQRAERTITRSDCYALQLEGTLPELPDVFRRGTLARMPLKSAQEIFEDTHYRNGMEGTAYELWLRKLRRLKQSLVSKGHLDNIMKTLAPVHDGTREIDVAQYL